MKTDSIALTARGKVVCQDVARHGRNYIIIADGCSSSPHSEVGAMLLVLTARKFIETDYLHRKLGEVVIRDAYELAKSLELPLSCLDATLLIGYDFGGGFRTLVYGDGTVWFESDENLIFSTHETVAKPAEKTLSLPYYLSYTLDDKREQAFHNAKPKNFINGVEAEFQSCYEYLIERPSFALIATDGISAISDSSAQRIDTARAVEKFLDYPVTEGNFLARRLWATLNREKWTLNDDLGLGVAIWK